MKIPLANAIFDENIEIGQFIKKKESNYSEPIV